MRGLSQAILRRFALCLLPAALGAGAALVLLLAASGPARQAYADTLNFPGCGATIQACIDSANPGDTILISAGDYTESLTLSKAVSLTGELSSTTILHALPNTRVLTVTGATVDSSVVISGLTFTGGNVTSGSCPDGCGGGLLLAGDAQPVLQNLRVMTNSAGLFGGGLYVDSALTITGSSFVSNTALGGYGGGLYAESGLTLTSDQFVNNMSQFGGGGVFGDTMLLNGGMFQSNACLDLGCNGGGLQAETVALTDTQFLSNTSQSNGGGMKANTVQFYGGLFKGNHCQEENFNCYGGGLYAGVATVSGTLFTHNSALAGGGGLYVGGDAALTDTQFVSNSALSASHNSFGGGFYGFGASTLADTSFVSNTAGQGGGLYMVNDVRITGGLFLSNAAIAGESEGWGGGMLAGGKVWMTGTQFVNNTARDNGGALDAFSTLALTDTQFISNSAGSLGGGLAQTSGDAWIVNTLFARDSTSGFGAALSLNSSSHSALLFSTIVGPPLSGSDAIFVSAGTLGITNTIVASHTIGIENDGGTVFQDYNLFFNNGSDLSGAVSGGAHSLTGDPAFVDPSDDDYHLGSGSAAIDVGTDAGVTTDFDGDPRPLGGGFDIGFDETTFTTVADLGLVKSASTSLLAPGQSLTYTLVYSNAGINLVSGVRVTDVVPANLTAISYTSSGAALTPAGLTLYAWQVANLAPGAGGVITVTGVLSGGQAGSVFTNTAAISTAYSDTNLANNTSAVGVMVANVAPVAADDAYTLPANSTLTVTAPGVLANDTDANGDALSAILAAGPLTGTLDFNGDGGFTYTPPLGYSDVVTFTYHANDGLADSNTGVVTLTVSPVANLGLVKSASTSLVAPGQALTYTLVFSNAGPSVAAGVRLTDIVPVNLTNVSVASSGAVITPTTGFTYAWQVADLAPGAGGVVTVTGLLADGPRGIVFTNTAIITTTTADSDVGNNTSAVGVTVANGAPVAASDAYTIARNGTLTVTATGVLANDSDANHDALTAGLVTGPLTGTLSLHADGSFTYAPPHGFAGVVNFAYRANDGLADSNTATVTITVTNAAPVAVNDVYTIRGNSTLTATAPGVLRNDSDANTDGLTASLVAGPLTGTLDFHADGSFTYTPPQGFAGVVTFTYRANDGLADSNTATVTITVTAVEHKLYLPLVMRS